MEAGKSEEEYSKEELRRQLYASLRSTGVLDSMKGQLRARLLEHLRHHNEDVIRPEKERRKKRKPTVIERLLSSLFLEYLEWNGFSFTVSVFKPESQMASWPPFSYEEMLELLHLDPCSNLHIQLKLGEEERECLAHQLVTVLQQMVSPRSMQEVGTQTSPAAAGPACKRPMSASCTSPREFERSLREVEDAYIKKKEAHELQRVLPHRCLEDKLTALDEEFDDRVNAEVALQVCRIRDHEINAARMEEGARYRRQLARDREELEDIHKSRMGRVKAREESLLERMLSKEKAVEASAYEQRQKILLEITSLRDRENKLRQLQASQERREEKLDEREVLLKAKEEEVGLERKALCAQADQIEASKRKEVEEQYRELCDRLHNDKAVLAAERDQLKEEKLAMAIELAASRSDKELIEALHRRLSVEEDQRSKLDMFIRELEEKLKQRTPSVVIVPDQRLAEQLRELQAELEQERLQRHASGQEKKTLERKLQQKKVELAAARSPQGEWIIEHKKLMATIYKQDAELRQKETKLQFMETEKAKLSDRHMKLLVKIDHLDTLVKKAQEEKDHLVRNLETLQLQQTTNAKDLLETATLLRKTRQALSAERLEHSALRSHLNAVAPSISRSDLNNERSCTSPKKFERGSGLVEHKSSGAVSIGKTGESFQRMPEAEELWTRLLSENEAKNASRGEDFVQNLVTSISKPFSSGNGEDNSSTSNDLSALAEITIETLGTGRGGLTVVIKAEGIADGVVGGSNEGSFDRWWDQEKYGEYSHEDAISSWGKAHLEEVATPQSWNEDDKNSIQGLITNVQSDRIGDCTSQRGGPAFSWNKADFEEGGEMTEECDEELLRDEAGAEVIPKFRTLKTNAFSYNVQNPGDTPGDQRAFLTLKRSEGNEDDGDRNGGLGITCTANEDEEYVEGQRAESSRSPFLFREQEKVQKRPGMKYLRLLNIAPKNPVDCSDCQYRKVRNEVIKNNQIECQTLEEDKAMPGNRPPAAEVTENEVLDAAEGETLQSSDTHKFMNLVDLVNMDESNAQASERPLSRLPEIGDMLSKQEIHDSTRENLAQRHLESYLLQAGCATSEVEINSTERAEITKDERDLMLDPQQFSKFPDYTSHALEALRSFIVMRKPEAPVTEETEKEFSPKSPKIHPPLELAIRNNQLVKLGKEVDEGQRGGELRNNSPLSSSHSDQDILMDTKSARDDESIVLGEEHTSDLITNRKSPSPLAPQHTGGTDSSGEESAYKSDSFEEEEEEDEDEEEEQVDDQQPPAHNLEEHERVTKNLLSTAKNNSNEVLQVNDLQSSSEGADDYSVDKLGNLPNLFVWCHQNQILLLILYTSQLLYVYSMGIPVRFSVIAHHMQWIHHM